MPASAKLKSMVGLQSAKSTSGVWNALINFALLDQVFSIPFFFVYQGLLGIFYQCHDG
jgi:hypothetical protein